MHHLAQEEQEDDEKDNSPNSLRVVHCQWHFATDWLHESDVWQFRKWINKWPIESLLKFDLFSVIYLPTTR